MLSLPLLAILLLNIVVVLYVMREGERTRTPFFLLLNAFALIVWGFGRLLAEYPVRSGPGLVLQLFGASLVPANILHFAITSPMGVGRPLLKRWLGYAVFLPPLAIVLMVDPRVLPTKEYGVEVTFPNLGTSMELQGVLLYVVVTTLAAMVLLGYRHARPTNEAESSVSKQLLAAMVALGVFSLAFWAISNRRGNGILPAPSSLAAILAQVSIFTVIREEESDRPLFLSRWVYYIVVGLTGFFAVSFLFQLYDAIGYRPLSVAQSQAMATVAGLLTLLLLATLRQPQAWFDRVFFHRAFEYRELVRETQRDLREAQERLRRAERLSMIGEVAARMAHEIKNPLGPIKGYTQMLREHLERQADMPDRQRLLGYLEVISEEVDGLDQKVHQLLDLSRRPGAILEPVDLNLVTNRTATLLRLEIAADRERSRALKVLARLAPTPAVVQADRARVEEALTNVARNAMEACGASGVIEISVIPGRSPEGRDGVALVVTDSGPGFSQQALSKLFAPFYTEKNSGTGLGLAIAQSHALEHQGALVVRNRPEGGSEVRLWLPVAPRPVLGAAPLPDMRVPLSDIRPPSSDIVPTPTTIEARASI